MCGIVGILNRRMEDPVDPTVLRAMSNAITHRGPDDDGMLIDRNIGLGMRRLSVIDVAGGHQPIANEAANCHIVFNGEIYNHAELRQAARARGHVFTTNTDTETILHAYEDAGIDCVQRLNGMFAFAIFDQRDRSVTIARDRLGIKPLYYAETPAGLVFGSEIKALLEHPDVSRDIDPFGLDDYLAHKFIPAPRTIYRSIRKLPPGHTLVWREGSLSVTPYWKLDYSAADGRTEADIADELLTRLRESVRARMISDVPLGAFLSGGIDSSAIVGLMAEVSDQPVQTFSVGFEEASYNELSHARAVAAHFGTRHTELIVDPDVVDLASAVLGQFDEPFGDSSALPTYLVSELARRHVTVALSGTGADELFAGYERYRMATWGRRYASLPRPARTAIEAALSAMPSGYGKRSLIHRLKRFTSAAALDPVSRHTAILGLFDDRQVLYTDDFRRQLTQAAREGDAFVLRDEQFSGSDPLERLLHLDAGTTLPDDYLCKDDRMSMAHGLELRVPFLDHTLVEFAVTIPASMKLRGRTTKLVLRQAVGKMLPPSIMKRPKHGFEVPIAHWLAGPLNDFARDHLLASDSFVSEVIPMTTVRQTLSDHESGKSNRSRELWSLIALEVWHRNSKASSVTETVLT